MIILVLISSYFNLAQEETDIPSESQTISEADSCAFWCRINTFLFGSAENRAGKGWVDRKEELVV